MQANLLIVDSNAPWVRSLVYALPGINNGTLQIKSWRIYGLSYWLANRRKLKAEIDAQKLKSNGSENVAVVPGWGRFSTLSTLCTARKLKRYIARHGAPRAIIYTLPQYSGVALHFRDFRQVYYAYDPYRFYAWNTPKIELLERRLLSICDCSFGISRKLVADLQQQTDKPVFYSPNATSEEFIGQMHGQVLPRPKDLPESGKIVGCIGQLNQHAYDWELVDKLSSALPNVTFAFIGGLQEPKNKVPIRIKRIFEKPNVRWLGAKRHDDLPCYLSNFDVCFNPLAINEHNDRRSLLRLYDYLAAGKPILSTAIAEAYEHRNFIEIGRDASECEILLKRILSDTYTFDSASRYRYCLENTWHKRAERFSQIIDRIAAGNFHC